MYHTASLSNSGVRLFLNEGRPRSFRVSLSAAAKAARGVVMMTANNNDRSAQGFAIGNDSMLRVNAIVGGYRRTCQGSKPGSFPTRKPGFLERASGCGITERAHGRGIVDGAHRCSGHHAEASAMRPSTAWQGDAAISMPSVSVPVVPVSVASKHVVGQQRLRRHSQVATAAAAVELPAAAWACWVLSRSTTV